MFLIMFISFTNCDKWFNSTQLTHIISLTADVLYMSFYAILFFNTIGCKGKDKTASEGAAPFKVNCNDDKNYRMYICK